MAIRRLRVSMRPSRWNSLITFETASRVEATMFVRSWCEAHAYEHVRVVVLVAEALAQVY
jgi:hypothetical protein